MSFSVDPDKTSPPLLWLSVAACVVFVAVRLHDLSSYGLWMDEVFSLRFARLDWASLFQHVANDAVHPPLFYLILKLWILIGGDSLGWIKLLPVIFSVATIIPLYFLCRGLGQRLAMFCLALVLMSLNAFLIFHSQELRMYGLLLFLSLSSMWLFVRFVRDESHSTTHLLALLVVNILLVYTHYFGWFTVAAECVFAFIYHRSNMKWLLLQTAAVAVLFLPWAATVVSAMSQKGGVGGNVGWIDKPGVATIPLFLAEFHGKLPFRNTIAVGFLVFATPLLIWLWQIFRQRDRDDVRLLVFLGLFCGLPIFTAFVVSQATTFSIWVDRYLIGAGVAYLLLVAISVLRIKNSALRKTFILLMVVWSLGVGVWNITQQRARVNWVGLSRKISESGIEGHEGKVFVFEEWAAMPLQESLSENASVQRVTTPDEIGESEFWLAHRATTWDRPQTAADVFRQKNCVVDAETDDAIDTETVRLLHVHCAR